MSAPQVDNKTNNVIYQCFVCKELRNSLFNKCHTVFFMNEFSAEGPNVNIKSVPVPVCDVCFTSEDPHKTKFEEPSKIVQAANIPSNLKN